MARQPLNQKFLRTAFLSGANAAYIEEMQAEYERNPGSVSDEWRHFFESLKEEQIGRVEQARGPSWASPRPEPETNGEILAALTGDYGTSERTLRDKLQQRAQAVGFEMSPAASLRTTQDSIRALMLIRAYRVMGHLAADLDPLGLADRKVHRELKPETYGFTDADLDRPIFIDRVLGLETATMRQVLKIVRRTYCRHIGVQYMHITTPAEKAWIQHRIEGEGKDISFTTEGRRAILNKLIETEQFEKFCEVKYTGTKRFGLDGAESIAYWAWPIVAA
jgi:2-oxoglutarate dehydrogenase E1 component